MEMMVGQKKYKELVEQWMRPDKEIFPFGILGTRNIGWSALLLVEELFNEFNKTKGVAH